MNTEILSEALRFGVIVNVLPERCTEESKPYYLVDIGESTDKGSRRFNIFKKNHATHKKYAIAGFFFKNKRETIEDWWFEYCDCISLTDAQIDNIKARS